MNIRHTRYLPVDKWKTGLFTHLLQSQGFNVIGRDFNGALVMVAFQVDDYEHGTQMGCIGLLNG
ncbi:hypothetical protein [Endozoicomonas sp.]|uniref:hypothetical protein n=1 Tax=Endozoicomonas sp. TaxID=1892382 RepID=UPI003AF4CB3A